METKEYALSVFDIKDYAGNGIVINADSVIAKIEKACNDIFSTMGRKRKFCKLEMEKLTILFCVKLFSLLLHVLVIVLVVMPLMHALKNLMA